MPKPKAKPITETEYDRLRKRADELIGCTENSPEERELEDIARCTGRARGFVGR